MQQKIKVAILFGGKSAEHDVSLQSAQNIINAINRKKYQPVLIKIDKQGKWLLGESNAKTTDAKSFHDQVALLPNSKGRLINLDHPDKKQKIDVVFLILHGPNGEDGTVQGLLRLAEVPFVGADVLGSAVGMDKDVMKRLLRDAGIPIAKFVVLRDFEKIDFESISKKVGLPCFVKPANLGSSVGINKVKNKQEFMMAVKEAFQYDQKILVEENIKGREIECAVLGNDQMKASAPGEIIVQSDFYSYQAKYIDAAGAVLQIPAKLNQKVVQQIQKMAIQTCEVLACSGLARVDFFLQADGKLLVNEINTLPGFTAISMYPKLWEASGIAYPELIDQLIHLAIKRFK